MILMLVLGLPASSVAQPPAFPVDFYSGVQLNAVQAQGGVSKRSNTCCRKDANGVCKVQTISLGQDTWEQGSMNRTLSEGGSGTVMNWFGNSSLRGDSSGCSLSRILNFRSPVRAASW